MRQFLFLWHDQYGNNAFAIVDAGSLPSAVLEFDRLHGCSYFAIFEGCHLEAREFTA